MKNFEDVLDKAQSGNVDAMDELIYQYYPMIKSIVYKYGKKVDKEELKEYLILKFIENTKMFRKKY